MKIRLGLIGPADSLENMMKVSSEFEDIEMIPFPYQQIEESRSILEKNNHEIDQWLFSGQAPYHYALGEGIITASQASYPALHGASFLGTLLEALISEQKMIYRFSVDTIEESEIETGQLQDKLQHMQFYYYSYKGYIPYEKLIAFHRELYDSGKIDAVITCLGAVYSGLKELGIPCYRVRPYDISIKQSLEFLTERGKSGKYRLSQLAVLGIENINFENAGESKYLSYREKHQKLDMARVLLDFSESIKGSFVQMGDDLSFIYTTRGELDLTMNRVVIHSLIDNIKMQSGLVVRIALGYGLTVLEAEQNLRHAFKNAQDYPEVVVVVNENREVTEYRQDDVAIHFQQRKWGEEWERHFKDASISPAVVSKIQVFATHYKKTQITSSDIATWLKSTERNGRRIISELEKMGLAEVIGEEQSGHRGRPRKLYKLNY